MTDTRQRIPVCAAAELPPGQRRIITVGKRSIGVFNIKGSYYAIRNVCPHQQAPLCKGRVQGTTLPDKVGTFSYAHEGEILRCPWHKWEFNITTGKSVFAPDTLRVPCYETDLTRAETCKQAELERYEVECDGQMVLVLV